MKNKELHRGFWGVIFCIFLAFFFSSFFREEKFTCQKKWVSTPLGSSMVSAVTVTAPQQAPFMPVTAAHSALACGLPPPRKESRGSVCHRGDTLERESRRPGVTKSVQNT